MVISPEILQTPGCQERYERCLANGCSPVLAEMLALRSFPGVRTNTTILKGIGTDDGLVGAPPDFAAEIRDAADRNGVSRQGKRWFGGLANHPFDPRAWVSDTHDIKTLAEERGYAVRGAITVPARPLDEEPPPPPRVARDLLDQETDRRIAQDPGLAAKDRRELLEETADLVGPPI